ncbi:MAG: hypothetical protein QY326_05055 [Bdellovibrionota bacterium]|nr:MAG: hypothetical protein QY326_05055 [Bdellovibrionota bacterium]
MNTSCSIVQEADLGSPQDHSRPGFRSFRTFPSAPTYYPLVVLNALAELYHEYNAAFAPLVEANREASSDYALCRTAQSQTTNYFVQIDMRGLPDAFLVAAPMLSKEEIRECLRHNIFEMENSVAMYYLLENAFAREGASYFSQRFRQGLNQLRQRNKMPIAVLAVTDQKYAELCTNEFGQDPMLPLADSKVQMISGFDRVFSPQGFLTHLQERAGNCAYQLYVRSSDPIEKLRNPQTVVIHPLLAREEIRKVIKAHAITLNVDSPHNVAVHARINDSKAYLVTMQMGFRITRKEDLADPRLKAYLATANDDGSEVHSKPLVRAKPLQGTYGCYGHYRGSLGDSRFMRDVEGGLATRGAYIVQPELQNPSVRNQADGVLYSYIDRNLFCFTDEHPCFLGGFRTYLPAASEEARRGRIHGSRESVYSEILPSP